MTEPNKEVVNEPEKKIVLEQIIQEETLKGCSIYETAQLSIITSNGKYCNFCYEICQEGKLDIISCSNENGEKCVCKHEGTKFFSLLINIFLKKHPKN